MNNRYLPDMLLFVIKLLLLRDNHNPYAAKCIKENIFIKLKDVKDRSVNIENKYMEITTSKQYFINILQRVRDICYTVLWREITVLMIIVGITENWMVA